MSVRQSTVLAVESSSDNKWFHGIRDDVDLEADKDLTDQRLEQWRPLWQNPFTTPEFGLTPPVENHHVPTLLVGGGEDEEKASVKPEMSRANTDLSQQNSELKPVKVTHAGPTWVNLFYDLAWAASFATLTQNGHLDDAWNNLSYFAFFLVVWWLWASQTLYSVHFYTNDWLHLISIFLQLIIFGLLAATTRGYDVTAYIRHSPGMDNLQPQTLEQMLDPEVYQADRLAHHSQGVIAISLAASRTILWFQHMFVLGYARVYSVASKRTLRIPAKLKVLPIGLFVSMGLFWAAMGVTIRLGKTELGAYLKFGFWAAGLAIELASHYWMESLEWESTNFWGWKTSTNVPDVSPVHTKPAQPELPDAASQLPEPAMVQSRQSWPVPHSKVNLRERLEGITTVILGEGLNGIAGTLYSVIASSGLAGPVYVNIACAAFLVYFLAYFYFEGPTGHRDPQGHSMRKMSWLLLHFPFHLGIILLLLCVKNQFILTGFLSTGLKTFKKFGEVMGRQNLYLDDPDSATNIPMKNFLLKRGIKWADEFAKVNATVTLNGTVPLDNVTDAEFEDRVGMWSMRVSLKIMEQLYKTFIEDSHEIEPDLKAKIQNYYTNDTAPLEDWTGSPESASSFTYESIITALLDPNIVGARYITGLAAVILISLAAINRLHSKPRDRFQWGFILSRVSMGVALLVLIALNGPEGSIQSLWVFEGEESKQAGVFRWILEWMVLPTLTIAFALQFIIEWILFRCSALAIARKRGRVSGPLRREFFRRPLSTFGWAQ